MSVSENAVILAHIERSLTQMRESVAIINRSTNVRTFFGRYHFLLDVLMDLSSYESTYKFTDPTPSVCLQTAKKQIGSSVDAFITRACDNEIMRLNKLTSREEIQVQAEKFCSELLCAFGESNTFWSGNHSQHKAIESYSERLFSNENLSRAGSIRDEFILAGVIIDKPRLCMFLFQYFVLYEKPPGEHKCYVQAMASFIQTQEDALSRMLGMVQEQDDPEVIEWIVPTYLQLGERFTEIALDWLNRLSAFSNLPEYKDGKRRYKVEQCFRYYMQIGRRYEKYDNFEKALSVYAASTCLYPCYEAYSAMASVLVKLNRLDEAINVLFAARPCVSENKKPPFDYDPDQLEIYEQLESLRKARELNAIIKEIENIQKKKTRGYVYKPRKKREVAP